MKFSLLACLLALCAVFATEGHAGPQEDSSDDFAAGRRLEGLPDLTQPAIIKDGALVCENDAVFAANSDVAAARGDSLALDALRTQCINWHERRRVRVINPMSNVHRYDLARRFGVVEFAIDPGPPNKEITGFVRAANLEPADR